MPCFFAFKMPILVITFWCFKCQNCFMKLAKWRLVFMTWTPFLPSWNLYITCLAKPCNYCNARGCFSAKNNWYTIKMGKISLTTQSTSKKSKHFIRGSSKEEAKLISFDVLKENQLKYSLHLQTILYLSWTVAESKSFTSYITFIQINAIYSY